MKDSVVSAEGTSLTSSALFLSVVSDKSQTSVGLCVTCIFLRKIHSDRGSTFYLCQRSTTDPNFPKYPRLPVLQCRGYEASPNKDK
jgi:hypothetical protein